MRRQHWSVIIFSVYDIVQNKCNIYLWQMVLILSHREQPQYIGEQLYILIIVQYLQNKNYQR